MHSRRSFLKTTSATAGLFLLSGNFWVRGMGLINSQSKVDSLTSLIAEKEAEEL